MAQLAGGGDSTTSYSQEKKPRNHQNINDLNQAIKRPDLQNGRESYLVSKSEITEELEQNSTRGPDGPYQQPFVLSTFPWIILSSIESSLLTKHAQNLLSDDSRDVEESCYALLDVILHDFPPEIFLQRPAVIQGLFGLLESKNLALSLPAFSCLVNLTQKFAIRFYQASTAQAEDVRRVGSHGDGDCSMAVGLHAEGSSYGRSSMVSLLSSRSSPSEASGKAGFYPSDPSSRPSVINDVEETEGPEETLRLQLHQIPLPVYLCAVMDACLNALGDEIPLGISRALHLLDQASRLLCSVLHPTVWTSDSVDSRKTAENLLHSLQATGNRVMFHAKRTERVFREARISRLIYMGLCKVLFTLSELVPVNQVENISGAFRACLPWICQDEALALWYPVIRETLLPYLKASHPTGYDTFKQAKTICTAMSETCRFLQDGESSSCTYQSDAEKAVRALPSLVYHQSSVFIQKCFQLCSDALTRTPETSKPFVKLMVRLLSYPNSGVQKQVYEILWHFTASILNVKTAADPSRTPGCDMVFVMSGQVLREIILYGLFQSETKIYAQSVLSLLSQKFLINNGSVWNRLRSAIRPLFCGVFIHADLDTDFGRRVISWTQDQEEDNAFFDEITRYRAAYCLMFHHNRLVRGHASDLVIRRVGAIRLHGDSLIPESQYVFESIDADPFSTDSMERGMKIWTDSRLDMAVRWTALRQIHQQLHRSVGQDYFSRLKGPQSLLTMLNVIAGGMEKDWSVDNMVLLLDSLLAVVYHNDKWRLENSQDPRIYESVVTVISVVHTGSVLWNKVQNTGASIIFLLTFTDVLLRKDGALSICCTFYRSVLSPLAIMFHDFNKKAANSTNCDLLRCPVADMLVLHWNVALAGGADQFLTGKEQDDWPADFAPRLAMDDPARALVRVTHPKMGFVTACHGLETAKSHGEAINSLDAMVVYVLLWTFLDDDTVVEVPACVESCFRYITVLPHNSSDLTLLRSVVQFVVLAAERFTKVHVDGPVPRWMKALVLDQSSLLLEALRKADKELTLLASGRTSLRVGYIAASKDFVRTGWQLLGLIPRVIEQDHLDPVELLDLFAEIVRNILMMPDVNFGALGLVCRCMTQFTGLTSVAKLPETISFIPLLITTLQTAHQRRPTWNSAFSGRSVILSATLSLISLVTSQVENQLFPAMLESWKDQSSSLSWLLSLWSYRDPLVRSAGLGIAAALSQTKEGRSLIISTFKFVPGGVWNACLSFLFSADEPDLVKFNAVNLLAIMLGTPLKRADLVLRDSAKNIDLEGNEALCGMLEELGFYRAVLQICQDFDGTRRARVPAEYLLGAVFNLCAVLVKLVGRRAVTGLKELKFYHSALHVCFLVKVFVEESPRLPDRLNMFRDLFGLVGQSVRADDTVAEIVSFNMHSISAALWLLDPTIAPLHQLHDLWTNIYVQLAECLQNKLVLDSVWRLLSENQRIIYGNVKTCLSLVITDPDHRRLQLALLTVLEVITEAERPEVDQFLWKQPAGLPVDGSAGRVQWIGILLTNFLVEKFSEPAALQVDAWVELLKRLLLRHEQVRTVSMDCGLLETVMDIILDMDSSISKDIHVHSRNVLKKKMTEPLRMCMELLMNLLFRNTKGKQLAAQRSLASVLISLWITIIQDTESLHILFLKLLCTFGARCQDALASFVKESEHHHTAPLTLFHVVITDLEENLAQPLPHPDITPLLFDIMGQMSLNPLCRVFLRKNLSIKRSMPIPSPRKPRVLQAIDAMWLHVLANLSFFEDGQIVILSKEDICGVLFDYLEIEGLFPEIYVSSMLILRNLAFCKKGMARLTGAKGVVARLIRLSSTHSEPKVRLYALSCLLELLYDQVKLRHAAKAIFFDEFKQSKPDDEPRMFDMRARVLACLDTDPALLDQDPANDVH